MRLVDGSGRLQGEGKAGAANIRLGLEVSWGQILAATDQALATAGLDRSAFSRIHAGLGLAGITGPADCARVAASAPPFASIAAETDAHTACLGAFGGATGDPDPRHRQCRLCAGRGRSYPIGGWGFEISDDGSGAQIGREAIRAAVRAYDGLAPASPFTAAVMARLGGHPPDVVAWVGSAKLATMAASAR